MDRNAQVEQHETTLNGFNVMDHQADVQASGVAANTTAVDPSAWESMKPKVAPYIWAWYDSHKDQKVATIGGFFPIRVSSFHIAEMVITAIVGPRPQAGQEFATLEGTGEGEQGLTTA